MSEAFPPHKKNPKPAQPSRLVGVPNWSGGKETHDHNDLESAQDLSQQELILKIASLVQDVNSLSKTKLNEIILDYCNQVDVNDYDSFSYFNKLMEDVCDVIVANVADQKAIELLASLHQTVSAAGFLYVQEILEKRLYDLYAAAPKMLSELIVHVGDQGYTDSTSGEDLLLLTRIIRQSAFARNRGVSEEEIVALLSHAKDVISSKVGDEQNPYLLNCQYEFFVNSLSRQIEQREYGLMYESFEQAHAKTRPKLLSEGVYTVTNSETGRVYYSTDATEVAEQMRIIEEYTNEWYSLHSNKDLDYLSKTEKKEQLEYDIFEADIALMEHFDKELDGVFLQERGVSHTELLADYQFIISSRVRSDIESQFHITLSDLTIKEQFYFIQYLKQVMLKDSDRMKEFVAVYGNDGLRTFLALENSDDTEGGGGDKTLGDSIVEVSRQEEVARQVFSAYGTLLDELDDIEAKLCRLYGCNEDGHKQMISQISRGIEKRAVELLKECVKKLQVANEEDRATIYEDVYRKLRQVDADTVFLNESFPEMKKENPDLRLEHIAGVGLQTFDNELVRNNPALLRQMRDIYIANWEDDDTGRDGEEMMNELEERLRGEGRVYFAMLESDDGPVVLSFASVADNEDGSSYASGLNRNPELEVGSIGTVLIKRVLHEEASGKRLTAKAKYGSVTARAYVNQYGSLGVGIEEKNEKVSLLMVYDAELRSRLVSAEWKSRKMAEQEASQYADTVVILEHPTLDEERGMYEERYVLTKFFPGGTMVFEKDPFDQTNMLQKAA